jgi:HAD superfamily hydrolase (TIGR01509 family)
MLDRIGVGVTIERLSIVAVVFDMDGLMLDTEPLYKRAWQQAGSELGFDLDDEFYATLIGRPTPDGEVELRRKFGAEFPLAQFRARWPVLWKSDAETRGIAAKAGLDDILAFADQQRLRIAVATSSDAAYTEFSLKKAGLAGRFAAIVTGDQVERGKPAPDIYLEAARQLACAPAQCVALEDSEAGIIAANGAGMIALLIPDLEPPSDVARRAAFRVLPSLVDARDAIAASL